MENCLQYDAIHDFLVWLRTGSNPADINRFRSLTGKKKLCKYHKTCIYMKSKIEILV